MNKIHILTLSWTLPALRLWKGFKQVVPCWREWNDWRDDEDIGRKLLKIRGWQVSWVEKVSSADNDRLQLVESRTAKIYPSYVFLKVPSKPQIHCTKEKLHTENFPTPSDFIFKTKTETVRVHHLGRTEIELKLTRQKTFYNFRAYGPTNSDGEQLLVIVRTIKKGGTKKFTSFYEGTITFVETVIDLNFCVSLEELWKHKKLRCKTK